MSRTFVATVCLVITACAGSDLPAPSPQHAASPRAPEAAFDPGPNPLDAGVAPSTAPNAAPSSGGHGHGAGKKKP
ncbi:MAG: hypothetical protein JWP87_1258 [Labilithrix sp.]|nr:hypothetical protein [Labilithrix sp.]